MSPSSLAEFAIDVDDPSFDLGEETLVDDNPSTAIIGLGNLSFKNSEWKDSMDQSARSRGKVGGINIGQTRTRTNARKGDYYDEDEDDSIFEEIEGNGTDRNFDVAEKETSNIPPESPNPPNPSISNHQFSPLIDQKETLEIDTMIQEMKKSVKFYQLCFIGFIGEELIEWFSQWKNWSPSKSLAFARYLLKERIIIEAQPSQSSKNSEFYKNYVYKFPFNISSNFYQIPGNTSNGVIAINAGGQLFHTTEKTLSSIPDTYFFTLLSKPPPDGVYFIDRNASLFEDILDYLRDGQICLPTEKKELEKLKREAQFFKLVQLEDLCNKALSSL